jgi:hypothetical protein
LSDFGFSALKKTPAFFDRARRQGFKFRAAYKRIATWLLVSCLPTLSASAADVPTGIYVLGSARNNPATSRDDRLGNIRDYDFVSGYTLRLFWSDLEPAPGQYEFGVLDEAIQKLSAIGQGLNVEVFTNTEPDWVLDGVSSTYVDHRGSVNPVPWDAFAQQRHAALFTALGGHVVQGAGAPHPLSQNPTLKSIDVTPVGLNYGVRDLNKGIRNHPQYTQQLYVDSVVNGVNAAAAAFPNDTNFLGFFSFSDGEPGVPIDEQIIERLDASYNGPGQQQLAFFVENLSDDWPVPLPNGQGVGNNLSDWVDAGGSTMMQALASWLEHTPDRDVQLASRNPATGIELAYELYGTRFFELYPPDIDGAFEGAVDAAGNSIIDGLRHWNDFLALPPTPALDADFNQDGAVNAVDLARWETGFGASGGATNVNGDADGDQAVDGADLLGWQLQKGSAPISSSTPVPEAPALALALLAATALALMRRQLLPGAAG